MIFMLTSPGPHVVLMLTSPGPHVTPMLTNPGPHVTPMLTSPGPHVILIRQVLDACNKSSVLSTDRSTNTFSATLASLPRSALEPQFAVSLAPLRPDTATLQGFSATAPLGFDTKDECAAVLHGLLHKNMLSASLLRTVLLPKLWAVPKLRPAVYEMLEVILAGKESTHTLSFGLAVFDFLLTQNGVTERMADSDASRMIFNCLECMLVNLEHAASAGASRGAPAVAAGGGAACDGAAGGGAAAGGRAWVGEQLLPAIVEACRQESGGSRNEAKVRVEFYYRSTYSLTYLPTYLPTYVRTPSSLPFFLTHSLPYFPPHSLPSLLPCFLASLLPCLLAYLLSRRCSSSSSAVRGSPSCSRSIGTGASASEHVST